MLCWSLVISEENKLILCYLKRHHVTRPGIIATCFEISLLDIEGNALISEHSNEHSFAKGGYFGNSRFVQVEYVFERRNKIFISNQALTFRCCMSTERPDTVKRHILRYARTRLAIQHKSFILVIENFSTLQEGAHSSEPLNESNSAFLTWYTICRNGKEFLYMKISTNIPIRILCKLSIMDLTGKLFKRYQDYLMVVPRLLRFRQRIPFRYQRFFHEQETHVTANGRIDLTL